MNIFVLFLSWTTLHTNLIISHTPDSSIHSQLTMLPVLTHETNATRLVHICEAPPGVVKMPRTMQLVKQLRKELNVPEIMRKQRRGGESYVCTVTSASLSRFPLLSMLLLLKG